MKNVQRTLAVIAASGLALGAMPGIANAQPTDPAQAGSAGTITGSLGTIGGGAQGEAGSSGFNFGSNATGEGDLPTSSLGQITGQLTGSLEGGTNDEGSLGGALDTSSLTGATGSDLPTDSDTTGSDTTGSEIPTDSLDIPTDSDQPQGGSLASILASIGSSTTADGSLDQFTSGSDDLDTASLTNITSGSDDLNTDSLTTGSDDLNTDSLTTGSDDLNTDSLTTGSDDLNTDSLTTGSDDLDLGSLTNITTGSDDLDLGSLTTGSDDLDTGSLTDILDTLTGSLEGTGSAGLTSDSLGNLDIEGSVTNVTLSSDLGSPGSTEAALAVGSLAALGLGIAVAANGQSSVPGLPPLPAINVGIVCSLPQEGIDFLKDNGSMKQDECLPEETN